MHDPNYFPPPALANDTAYHHLDDYAGSGSVHNAIVNQNLQEFSCGEYQQPVITVPEPYPFVTQNFIELGHGGSQQSMNFAPEPSPFASGSFQPAAFTGWDMARALEPQATSWSPILPAPGSAVQLYMPGPFALGSNLGTAAPVLQTTDIRPPVAMPAVNHNEGRLRCPKGCRKTFGRPSEYHRHMKTHEGPRFKCPLFYCDKAFSRQDKLLDHARQGHKGKDLADLNRFMKL
ncbi:hypothetical protein BDW02DRAFT_564514 [Decorospora gaudefroyi]|uniref:C2H2-type domain-containing protein n=1 Tax=Decorospora gaudefroyi TaxID=184978 RepID=A0A6A5KRY0_9PLEO|nr:hypothetical protein BDW02DRAFT_564514 [Decorospora gaudefroyi]